MERDTQVVWEKYRCVEYRNRDGPGGPATAAQQWTTNVGLWVVGQKPPRGMGAAEGSGHGLRRRGNYEMDRCKFVSKL